MAQDGVLGKKLIIALTDSTGKAVAKAPEILKWSAEAISSEEKKYPLGEEAEHKQTIYSGWKGTLEGQDTNAAYNDLVDAMLKHQEDTGGTLTFTIFTTTTYKNGEVRKYKYEDVTFDGFKESADGNNKPITNSINWQAKRRVKIS